MEYFDLLFTSSNPSHFSQTFGDVPVLVSNKMSKTLTSKIFPEEVKAAIFSMNPDKTPGLDRMTHLLNIGLLGTLM